MQPWTWLVAYVVGFGLLQLFLYRRFHRQTPTSEPTGGTAEPRGGPGVATAGPDATTTCQHCDTLNERHRMVRYCRTCTHPLR